VGERGEEVVGRGATGGEGEAGGRWWRVAGMGTVNRVMGGS